MIFSFYIAFIFALMLQPGIFWPQLAPLRIILVLGSINLFFFLLTFLQGKAGKLFDPTGKSLVAFIIVQVISNFRVWLVYALRSLLIWGKILVIYFIAVGLVNNISRAKKYIWAFMIPGLFIGVVGIYNYFYQPEWLHTWAYRTGSYGDYSGANDLAHLMILLFPFLFKEFESRENAFFRFFLVLAMCMNFYVGYLAVSRAGLVGHALVVFLSIMTSKTFSKFTRNSALLIIIIVVGIFLPTRIQERPDYKINEWKEEAGRHSLTYVGDKSAVGRFDAWWKARQLLKQNPVFGVGDGQFIEHWFRDAHSLYLIIAAEKGFPGIFTFAAVIIFSFIGLAKALKLKDEPKGSEGYEIYLLAQATAISLVGFLLHGFFASKEKELLFYMLVALSSVIARLAEDALMKKEKNNNSSDSS